MNGCSDAGPRDPCRCSLRWYQRHPESWLVMAQNTHQDDLVHGAVIRQVDRDPRNVGSIVVWRQDCQVFVLRFGSTVYDDRIWR